MVQVRGASARWNSAGHDVGGGPPPSTCAPIGTNCEYKPLRFRLLEALTGYRNRRESVKAVALKFFRVIPAKRRHSMKIDNRTFHPFRTNRFETARM
jgi:hypothetical protein